MDHSRRTGNIIELALNLGHLILEPLLEFGDLLVDGWANYEYLKSFRKRRTDWSSGGQMLGS